MRTVHKKKKNDTEIKLNIFTCEKNAGEIVDSANRRRLFLCLFEEEKSFSFVRCDMLFAHTFRQAKFDLYRIACGHMAFICLKIYISNAF